MFWADELLKNVKGPQVINDSWTPSGVVHMGSLKGPVIHDILYKILKERKEHVEFRYGIDDADPIDGLSSDLMESHGKYLGVPLHKAPAPDGNGSFGDYFGNKMKKLLDDLGIVPDKLYKTSELYKNGTFNKAISFVLNHVSKIRKVYAEMYKKKIADDWFPLQIVCPNCGKVGTTKVTGWDGKEVSFCCSTDLVSWAQGCGICSKISPFDGNSKMSWKVEWAAKWWTFGITIEGAGKDHGSAGGSYDVAMQICKDVFEAPQPLKFVYEFFLSHGKKMSSSKGIGLTGEELLEVMGPERTRFLMIYKSPFQTVEFTPYHTGSIPKVFDEYQKAVSSQEDDEKRMITLSQINSRKNIPKIRFSVLTQWVQMPNMEEKIKKEGLREWAQYAKIWVEKFAPESEKFLVQKEMPEQVKNLSDKQKEFLEKVSEKLDKDWGAEEFQKNLYDWAKEIGISSKDAFSAIYLSLIGKDHGPKAAWLMLSLDRAFVKKRFTEDLNDIYHLSNKGKGVTVQSLNREDVFSIDPQLKRRFPSVSVGVALIKGVVIKKVNQELEREKERLLLSLKSLTTEQIGQYKEVVSYRKLYKDMGVDWHSRRPSPEALLRRIALKKGLYSINTCVDAYNLVVMKHRISVGAFDYNTISFPTVLRFAKREEEILLLGDDKPTQYKEKEVAYFDQEGGFNIDFNFRDAQRTAVTLETKNLYINVDGVYDITPQEVERSLKETCNIIIKYCGGKLELFGID